MSLVRTLGFGLVIAAYLMVELATNFSKAIMNYESFSFIATMVNIPSGIVVADGMKAIMPAAYIALCIGIGFILGTFVEWIFNRILYFASAPFIGFVSKRHETTLPARYKFAVKSGK